MTKRTVTTQATDDNSVIPPWELSGEWFDICSCYAPCPCTMAQAPTGNTCEALFAFRLNKGHFGDTPMAGLKVVMFTSLVGNVWAGAKLDGYAFFDASADDDQRRALKLIFGGKAGGWMKQLLPSFRSIKGGEFADISIQIDDALERWAVQIPGVVDASGVALTGPTADPTKRVQTFNPPGSEVGPTTGPVTWGKSVNGRWQVLGFDQNVPAGRNSKHIPFEWHGPDAQ